MMKVSNLRLRGWSLAAAVVMAMQASPAPAQGVFDMGVLTNTVSIPRGGAATTRSTRSAPSPGERAISVLPTAFDRTTAQSRATRLTYTTTAALRERAVRDYIERASRQYPEAARLMAAQFARHDYSSVYGNLISGTGLRKDDAADALTAYTVLGWQIANNFIDDLPSARIAAARRQIAAALAGDPQLSAPDRRAALGEEMKLLMVTLHAGWQSAQKEGRLTQFGDGVARLFRIQSNHDLRSLELTDAGFRPVGSR